MKLRGRAAVAGGAWRAYRELRRPGSPGLGARVRALPRLARAVARGEYRLTGRLALMLLGLAYIVSPVDVLPEFLPIIGVADDIGVLMWLVGSALGETERFLTWERERPQVVPGHVVHEGARR
ncbi:MAG: DUF1232 domain-containing protein [Streptosporangiales bacterium]|nr:DUF1232 domain-containing protein [Streptosporangiales bacterium]